MAGGLGGMVSCGTTGIGAMFSHVQTPGNVLFVYASHVGISSPSSGSKLGLVERPGCSDLTNTCGAATKAFNDIVGSFSSPPPQSPTTKKIFNSDYQQDCLEAALKPNIEQILADQLVNNMVQLSLVTAEAIHLSALATIFPGGIEFSDTKRRVQNPSDYPPVKIALVGGVHINTSPNCEDYFQLTKIEIVDVDGLVETLELTASL